MSTSPNHDRECINQLRSFHNIPDDVVPPDVPLDLERLEHMVLRSHLIDADPIASDGHADALHNLADDATLRGLVHAAHDAMLFYVGRGPEVVETPASEPAPQSSPLDLGSWLYPEGSTPADCVAIDVTRFIDREGDKKAATSFGFDAIAAEFERLCKAREATEVVHMKRGSSWGGSNVLAVANGEGWCCLLVVVDGQGIGVIAPRFT